jgi:exopolysaccharide biosynthesis polyprenyl glycosylphosphotransferase
LNAGHGETDAWHLLPARKYIPILSSFGALCSELALIAVAALIAIEMTPQSESRETVASLCLLSLPAYLFASLSLSAYKVETLRDASRSVTRTWMSLLVSFGIALSAALSAHLPSHDPGRLLPFFAIAAASLTLARAFWSHLLRRLDVLLKPAVFLIGDGSVLRYKRLVAGVINVGATGWQPDTKNPYLLTQLSEAIRYADRVIVICNKHEERSAWGNVVSCMGLDAEVFDPAESSSSPLERSRRTTKVISRSPLTLSDRAIKRAFDLLGTMILAPVVLPLLGALCLLIVADSPGSPLFIQERIGRNNRRYMCVKLRTLYADTQDNDGHRSAVPNDPRVTRIGKFLRRTSLDELPQLWNVLRGDMSLVGPRPHALGSKAGGVPFWEAVPGYWARHSVKPGLTGLAQIRGFRGATLSRHALESRVQSDREYIQHWSVWLDMAILVRTFGVLIHRNAF